MLTIKTNQLVITHEMLTILSELDEFKGAWRMLGRLTPEVLKQLRKVATIESVGSSTRIEGAKLSDKEVELLLSRLETKSFASRDEEEVAGYAQVMETIFSNYDIIPITENYIKQLHSILLEYSGKDERHRGDYKKLTNHVEAFDATGKSLGIVFETTSPFNTPREMEALIGWTQQNMLEKTVHPILLIGIFTVVFLAIHPFQDGNGRISRIMSTLMLMKNGYVYVPYSSLESVIEQHKEQYYIALRRTQQSLKTNEHNWTPWLLFFLQALQRQKRNLEIKIEREKLIRATLPILSSKILELVEQHGQMTVAHLVNGTGANRNTIKKRLIELVKLGHLTASGQRKSTWYSIH